MKHIAIIKQSLILVAGLLAALLTSCIKDDLAECSKLTLKVEGVASDGEIIDITRLGDVTDATLYIFDANKNFQEARKLDKDFILAKEVIKLDNYPDNTKLYIVAWGNLEGGKQNITSQPKTMDDLTLQLKSDNEGYAQSPDSLFFGARDVTSLGSGIVGGDGEVVIRLVTSTYTVKTEGLQNALNFYGLKSSGDFDFYINNTLDSYDAAGNQVGDSIPYNPEGQYDTQSVEWLSTGPVDIAQYGGKQTAFAGEKLGVRVKSKTGSVDRTIYKTEDGEDLFMPAGGRANFVIRFAEDGNISIRSTVTPWGVVDDEIEF